MNGRQRAALAASCRTFLLGGQGIGASVHNDAALHIRHEVLREVASAADQVAGRLPQPADPVLVTRRGNRRTRGCVVGQATDAAKQSSSVCVLFASGLWDVDVAFLSIYGPKHKDVVKRKLPRAEARRRHE